MQKIDFFILEDSDEQKALRFSCALIEKIYLRGDSLYVHTTKLQQAKRLNTLLWTFKDVSFIPHTLDINDKNIAIKIGYDGNEAAAIQNILNLNPETTLSLATCQRIYEIVFADSKMQQHARERYRCYRAQTNEPKIHKIKFHEYERALNEFN